MARDNFVVLKGLQRSDNPDVWLEAIMIVVILLALVVGSIFMMKLPKIKKKKWDNDIYDFILNFKELTLKEREILKKFVKNNHISPKYNIVVIETTLQKYLDIEIIKLEQSNLSSIEKEEIENEYFVLKEKLFPTDK